MRLPKVKIVFPVIICWLLLPARALAGANNAHLVCKSTQKNKTAPVSLEGDVPGDFAEFHLALKMGDAVLSMAEDPAKRDTENDHIYVIESFRDRVFTLAVARSDGRDLLLYAIPSSLKWHTGENRLREATFEAVLAEAPKPNYSGPLSPDAMFRRVQMLCKYHYAI